MSVDRHIPLRSCVGCRNRSPQAEMDRFTRMDGRLEWNRSYGRGAYLHRREECRRAFVARKPGAMRSLRAFVSRSERTLLIQGS